MAKSGMLFLVLFTCLVGCAADKPAAEPDPGVRPKPVSDGPSLGSFAERLKSDAPREASGPVADPSIAAINGFRGIFSPRVREAYEKEYLERRTEPGLKNRMSGEADTYLQRLGLNMSKPEFLGILKCSAALTAQGRTGNAPVFESQYAAKFWAYGVFAQLDNRHDGSVGGFPEEVPGIEKFPEKKRDFKPAADVEPYRKAAYFSYRFLLDELMDPAASVRAPMLSLAKECDARNPPTISDY